MSEESNGPSELEAIVCILNEIGCSMDMEKAKEYEKPIDMVRDVINGLNERILELFFKRSKYKINKDNYNEIHPEHSQEDKERLGDKDKIFLRSKYLPCLEEVCEPGNDSSEDFKDCLAIDRELMPLLNQRIWVGKAVALYKGLRDLATNVPEREEKIKYAMTELAKEKGYGIPPEKIASLFHKIIDMNKEIQRCYKNNKNGIGELLYSMKVGSENLLESSKQSLLNKAKLHHPGENCVAKHRMGTDKLGFETYIVEVFRI